MCPIIQTFPLFSTKCPELRECLFAIIRTDSGAILKSTFIIAPIPYFSGTIGNPFLLVPSVSELLALFAATSIHLSLFSFVRNVL